MLLAPRVAWVKKSVPFAKMGVIIYICLCVSPWYIWMTNNMPDINNSICHKQIQGR